MRTRDPRWIYAAFAAALAVSTLGLNALVSAREAAAARDHEAAVRQAAESPGTPVTDPALPAGVVVVDLVPLSEDLVLTQPAKIRAGALRSTWTTETPARFEELPEGRVVSLQVSSPYATESVSVTRPTGSRGSRVAVRAVTVEPPRVRYTQPGVTPEKWMELDLGRPGRMDLRWRQSHVVVSEISPPRIVGDPTLATRVREEWKQQRNHFDPSDRKLDYALLRIGPGTTFDEIRWAVAALLSPRRTMSVGGSSRVIAAFDVEVEPPLDERAR